MDDWKLYVLDDYDFAEFSPSVLVLDIGCGNGSHLKELQRRGCLSVGIEPNFERVTSRRSQKLRVIQASGEQMPLKSASCDGLICKVVTPYTDEGRTHNGMMIAAFHCSRYNSIY